MARRQSVMMDQDRAKAYYTARQPFDKVMNAAKKAGKVYEASGLSEAADESKRVAREAQRKGDEAGRIALKRFGRSPSADKWARRSRRLQCTSRSPPTSLVDDPKHALGSQTSDRHHRNNRIKQGNPHKEIERVTDMDSQYSVPSECSRTRRNSDPSYSSAKRHLSPSRTAINPKKRRHIDRLQATVPSLPRMMDPSPSVIHLSPSSEGLGTQAKSGAHQCLDQQESNFSPYDELHSGRHTSSSYYSTRRKCSPYGHNASFYQNRRHGYEPPHSSPPSMNLTPRHLSIDATQINKRPACSSRTSTPESCRAFQDVPFRTQLERKQKCSAHVTLQSPIWTTDIARDQQRRSGHGLSSPNPYTPRKQKNKHGLQRVYPFKDGGLPGEGGSSSDDNLMLHPEIIGRDCYMGGSKYATRIIPAAKAIVDSEKVYSPLTYDEVQIRRYRVQRRLAKLFFRELKAEWDVAKDNNDEEGMDEVELRAAQSKKPKVPLRDELYEGEKPSHPPPLAGPDLALHSPGSVPLSAARNVYQIHSPSLGALLPSIEQLSQSQGRPDSNHLYAEETFQQKSKNIQRGTPKRGDGRRSENRIPLDTESRFQGKSPSSSEVLCDQEPKPSGETLHHSDEAVIYKDGPFQAAEGSRKRSMSETIHSMAASMKKDSRQSRAPEEGGIPGMLTPEKKRNPHCSRIQPDRVTSHMESATVIVISSTESSPVVKLSQPMRERIAPPKKARARKSEVAKGEGVSESPVDFDFVRQQRCAENTVAKELNVANAELEEAIFGEAIGLTIEEVEHQAELKRREVQTKKEEAKLQAEIAREEARIAKINKQAEIVATYEREKLLKDREEFSKKQKREIERRKRLIEEEQLKDEKRKKAAERIEAQRVKDKADTLAREREKEKSRKIEFDKLKLEVMRKDLELKRLQAASLNVGRASIQDASEKPVSKALPLEEDESSLFLPESSSIKDVDMQGVDIGTRPRLGGSGAKQVPELFAKQVFFQTMLAQDTEIQEAEQGQSNAKKRSAACKAQLDAIRKSATQAKEMSKRSKRSSKTQAASNPTASPYIIQPQQHDVAANYPIPCLVDRSMDAQLTKTYKNGTGPSARICSASAPAPNVTPKTYSSQVRFLTEIECEDTENAEKARERAEKQKRQVERRAKELPGIAERRRQKIVSDAKKLGINLKDEEVEVRVKVHMKKLEVGKTSYFRRNC